MILLYPNHLFLHFVLDLLPIHFLFPVLMMSHFYLVMHYPILDQLILSLVMHLPILMVYSFLDLNSIQILFHQQVAIFLVVFVLGYDHVWDFDFCYDLFYLHDHCYDHYYDDLDFRHDHHGRRLDHRPNRGQDF